MQNRRTQTALNVASVAIVTLALTACGKPDAAKSEVQKVEPPRPVRTIQVGLSAFGDISYLPGEVRPRFEQRYGFRVPGKIARRVVDVGQTVKVGQVLAVLDSQDVLPAINAQASQVDVVKTDLKFQQSELKRQQELRDKGFVSGASLERQAASAEAAQARVAAAQSQLASAQNSLAFQTLRADKAGVVVGIDADAGSVVAAGQSVVRVAELGEREIVVNVPERAVGMLRSAKGFAVVIDALPGKVFQAKLRELSPAADAASRTYPARFTLIGADDSVKLGMSATVQLALKEAQAIVVPHSALYTRDDKTRVWVVDPTALTANAVEVKVSESTQDSVVIASGLKAGDLVVTAGANLLQAGQRVVLPAAVAPAVAPAAAPAAAPVAAPPKAEPKK
ncbi:MAG: efflux RND transporter periplasmic adaptor subunit [Betaproteobacteria bacterium]|nr:MAG: efflux RND transporter periplasmic adaptor subunit [Betaproteobacteria bacterium]